MRPKKRLFAVSLLLAVAALSAITAVHAATPVGVVTHLSGTLLVKRADGTRMLSVKSEIYEGDALMTQADTYARLKFNDDGEVVMRPDSDMAVNSYAFHPDEPQRDNVLLALIKGGMRSVTGLLGHRNREKFSVQTPTATIGIRGTHFGALLCQGDCGAIRTPAGGPPPDGLHVDVAQGAVSLTNQGGMQVVNAGQFAYVRDNVTPPVIQPPSQGIQVTMPTQISRNAVGGRTVGAKRDDVECAVQ